MIPRVHRTFARCAQHPPCVAGQQSRHPNQPLPDPTRGPYAAGTSRSMDTAPHLQSSGFDAVLLSVLPDSVVASWATLGRCSLHFAVTCSPVVALCVRDGKGGGVSASSTLSLPPVLDEGLGPESYLHRFGV